MQQTPAYQAVIERIVERASDTRSFFLRLRADQALRFRPGQFLSFQLPGSGKTLTRAYTIASNPEDNGLLEICLNLVPDGPGSHYLFSRRVGDSLAFTGPWGHFVLDRAPNAECVFIADRTGIAAIRPMLWRALNSQPQFPIHVLYGAQKEEDLLYRAELEAWAGTHMRLSFVLKEASHAGLQGTLLERVEAWYVKKDAARSRQFYICGIGRRVVQLRDLLRQAGYERRGVRYERW